MTGMYRNAVRLRASDARWPRINELTQLLAWALNPIMLHWPMPEPELEPEWWDATLPPGGCDLPAVECAVAAQALRDELDDALRLAAECPGSAWQPVGWSAAGWMAG